MDKEISERDQARVTLTDYPFSLNLICTVTRNAEGELFSVHVQAAVLGCRPDTPDAVRGEITANKEALMQLALESALHNRKTHAELIEQQREVEKQKAAQ